MQKTNISILNIIVSPKSSKSLLTIDANSKIKAYLHSAPINGKANQECILLFSKTLNIAKSKISIEKGTKGKNKKIQVIGVSEKEIYNIINSQKFNKNKK